ncbi:MAG: AraC family transcriptional regulator [Bacteroidales bacterium]
MSTARLHRIPPEGDPSPLSQSFRQVLPKVLCCRYWWMSEWSSRKMSFPYWRLYWNPSGRARVVYKKTIALDRDRLILIPPHTPFSTHIEPTPLPGPDQYALRGGRVRDEEMEETCREADEVLHLFIHFTLGFPFDAVAPGVFVLPVEDLHRAHLKRITGLLMQGQMQFREKGSLEVHALLFSALSLLPDTVWNSSKLDERILRGIRFMNRHLSDRELRNGVLAADNGMSVPAYARLFRDQTGTSPRQYLLKMRVEQACNLLHHSTLTLEEIAAACGFSDRYHFTRTFSRLIRISPAAFRKHHIPGS